MHPINKVLLKGFLMGTIIGILFVAMLAFMVHIYL